jgi:hypothetical protein
VVGARARLSSRRGPRHLHESSGRDTGQSGTVITPYDPGRSDPDDALLAADLDESLQRFAVDRSRLVDRLRQLSDEAWTRTAEHGEYSHYSVFIMFRHLALHDFFHAYRIEELLLKKEWAGT